MPHLHHSLFLPRTALLAALMLIMVGCTGSHEVSQSPKSDDSRSGVSAVRDTNQGTRYFIRGLTKTQLESYDEAIIYYQQALKHVTDSAAVFAGLARAHSSSSHHRRAIDYASKAVAASPDHPAYYYQLAEIQQDGQRVGEAITTYRALTEQFPKETEAFYAMGKLQLRNDSVQAAIETFKHVLTHRGQNVRARYQLLRIYRQQGNLPGMIRMLEALIEADRSNPDLYFMLVDVYRQRGEIQTAIATLERLRSRDPGNAEAAFRLVELYHQTGADDKADTLLEQTLEMNDLNADVLFDHARSLYFRPRPNRETDQTVRRLLERVLKAESDHSQALYMLGTMHLQQGEHADALRLLERAVDQNPRNQKAWIRVVLAGVRTGEYERTLELADEALVLFPRQFTLLRLAGTACLQSGRNQKAVDYLSRALETNSSEEVDDDMRSNVASMLGMVYSRLGETSQSDSLYQQAIAWNRDNVTALNNYAYSLAEQESRLDKALDLAHRAVDLAPDAASFLDTLGWVYFKMNRLDEAALWVKKALRTGNASAAVHEHYGDIQYARGNDSEALEYWNKATDMNPSLESSVKEKIEQLESTR